MSWLLGIIKALPAVITILDRLEAAYDKWQVSQIKKHYDRKSAVRTKIINQMNEIKSKEPFNEEAYKRLSRDLAVIDSIY